MTIVAQNKSDMITHGNNTAFDLAFYLNRLENQANLVLPFDDTKALLEGFASFEFGRFFLINKGLNGYWTAYMIIHGPKKENLHPLEHWFLHRAPAVRATQERYHIFNRQLQKYLKSNSTIASIPCGLMDDLFDLDYSDTTGIVLQGIDLDQESLDLAQKNAAAKGCQQVSFLKGNAWDLQIKEAYSLLASNGLNIYEPNDDKIIALYQEFYNALIPGGVLITSFMTPPPALSPESSWKDFNPADVLIQRALVSDVLQLNHLALRTENQTRQLLEKVGFTVLECIYDSQGMFPTIVAKK